MLPAMGVDGGDGDGDGDGCGDEEDEELSRTHQSSSSRGAGINNNNNNNNNNNESDAAEQASMCPTDGHGAHGALELSTSSRLGSGGLQQQDGISPHYDQCFIDTPTTALRDDNPLDEAASGGSRRCSRDDIVFVVDSQFEIADVASGDDDNAKDDGDGDDNDDEGAGNCMGLPASVVGIIFLTMLEAWNMNAIWTFLPNMIHRWVPESQIGYYCGFVGAAFFFGQAATGVMYGRAADRYGRRPVILWGVFGTAIASLLFGFAPSLEFAVIARFFGGALNGNTGVCKYVLPSHVRLFVVSAAGSIHAHPCDYTIIELTHRHTHTHTHTHGKNWHASPSNTSPSCVSCLFTHAQDVHRRGNEG